MREVRWQEARCGLARGGAWAGAGWRGAGGVVREVRCGGCGAGGAVREVWCGLAGRAVGRPHVAGARPAWPSIQESANVGTVNTGL